MISKTTLYNKRQPISKELTYLSRLYYGVFTRKLSALEIERYYYFLLVIKEGENKITPKELADKIDSDKVFVVKVLDYFYERGLINRVVNDADRRQYFICLTKKAELLIPIIVKAFNETTEEAFRGIKKEEKEVFYKVIDSIKNNLLSLPSDEMKVNFKKIKNKK